MNLPLTFHPAVHDELDDAYQWYEQRRTGLGDDFLAAIEEVFRRIAATPAIYGTVFQNVRCRLPRRFPYAVYYRIHPDRVEILAVYHTSRDASGWQSRV
jgi:toxin ParE1/3/4